MDLLTKDKLLQLAESHDQPCVSLFMPTHRTGREVEQNAIRFKNLLRRAQDKLVAGGMRTLQVQKLVKPAQTLLGERPFWHNQSDGLALFLSPLTLDHFRLPLSFDELVVTTRRFHLKPLVTLFNNDGRFQRAPTSLAESLQYDVQQKQLQFHTSAPARGGKRDAMYFGTGDAGTDEKELLLHFFQQVDNGLHELLAGERAPLVLAGVDYLLPIYDRANSYSYLMKAGITGNPDDLSANELHQQAWAIVEPYFQQEQRQAAERYHELAGSDSPLASSEIKDVVPAAVQGRVDCLFVAVGVQQWGDVDQRTGEVVVHDQQNPDDHDLLDFAAIHTLSKGGGVFAVAPDKVPDDTSLAAVYRY
jgi:hypothetical protein